MYAIVQEGGHQFRVTTGDVIDIDREVPADQKSITLEKVLLVGGEGSPKVGAPVVAGATVTADVLGPVKDRKVEIVKYNRRKGYHKHTGHRQRHTRVRITNITA